jgi:hypothetical protein
MADRSTYLNNTDDQISAQKRMEQQGRAVVNTVGTLGAIAAFIIGSRKISLARAFSSDVREAERHLSSQYSRFMITEIAGQSDTAINKFTSWSKNVFEALTADMPSGTEQLDIAVARMARYNAQRASGLGVKIHSVRASQLPSDVYEGVKNWGTLKTMVHGPIAAIAPRTPLRVGSKLYSSGKHGSIAAAGYLMRVRQASKVVDGEQQVFSSFGRSLKGVHTGVAGSAGSRTEFLRTFQVRPFRNIRQFTENVIAPMGKDMRLEHRRQFLEDLYAEARVGTRINRNEKTTEDVINRIKAELKSGGVDADERMHSKSGREAIKRSYRSALKKIVDTESVKPSTIRSYELYKIQMKLGVGDPFSSFESGGVQSLWRKTRESMKMVIKDPMSGRGYGVRGSRYMSEGKSISGHWSEGRKGKYYMYPAGGTAKRHALSLAEGTFIGQFEQLTGWGISVAPNRVTDFISKTLGAKSGSYGEYAIRRYTNTFGALAVYGGGAYMAWKLTNYIARQTIGWGIDDVAAKAYTSAREFQQNVINQLGIVDHARNMERAFPGSMKSPAAVIARMTAPYWMMRAGGKLFGKFGAQVGLASGIALALLTWGDITQSPEELHRIYTGEQDIPVRKGRWWMFGKTPFGGGKVMYYRPHWYPLMRSKYQYQGQLWDSETDEIASTGPLAPLFTPLLKGKLWDPYEWEKKHYHDRPYPLTGEMFEPTMPFAWLGNATIGGLIKPQRIMHQEYWGADQGQGGTPKTYTPGVGAQLGIGSFSPSANLPNVNPNSPSWLVGQGMYSQAEQMGIRGFLWNQMNENMTGRPDFLPQGPVIQSASRATGAERAYWDMNIGDPVNATEFFRRILPHRRRGIEEYNPIPNEMPDWMPGEDYFNNFKTGDPYTKVEMGEARLPGPGYESLHQLHSGIPHVYDAMDRFMILADVAPYSKEYSHYRILAKSMTREDPYWSQVFEREIEQRAKTQEEYEFLDLDVPEDVPLWLKPMSSMYRRAAAFATGPGSITEPFISAAMSIAETGKVNPFFMAQFPISKFFPYKTATQTYKDYRLQGSEFTEWGNPFRDFIDPYINKIKDTFTQIGGSPYIPQEELDRREYEEYFDKLQYVKYKKLSQLATDQGNSQLATQMANMASKTMVGANPFVDKSRLMSALPKRERAFFAAFSDASPEDRDQIEKMVSPEMAKIYRAQWSMRDGAGRGRVRSDQSTAEDTMEYFKDHNLPSKDWTGWSPDVDMKDVQLKVVRNEGMNIHNFDLWESQERSMGRRPYVPSIGDIHTPVDTTEGLRRALHSQMENDGYKNTRTFITQTPASQNTVNLRVKVKRDRSREQNTYMREAINA